MYPSDPVSPFVFVEDAFDALLQLFVFAGLAKSLQLEIVRRSGQAGYRQEDRYAAFALFLDGFDDFRFFALASLAVFSNSKALNFLGTGSPLPNICFFL